MVQIQADLLESSTIFFLAHHRHDGKFMWPPLRREIAQARRDGGQGR